MTTRTILCALILFGTAAFENTNAAELLAGVGLALTLPGRLDRRLLGTDGWIGEAVVAAATILVITGAGGAFGKVLQNSGIADVLGETLADLGLGIWLPFLIAAAIKTAQGSSTVAIITTAGLLAPLLDSLGLGGETARALCVVASSTTTRSGRTRTRAPARSPTLRTWHCLIVGC